MIREKIRIAVVAPGTRLEPRMADQIQDLAAKLYPKRTPDIAFHPQCFLSSGHFAGNDASRAAALIETANDESVDAVWFGRGGYGSCRIAQAVLAKLTAAAKGKLYLGYSDVGFLLAGLYRHGFARVAHGPMVSDIRREGGEEAIARALAYLVDRDAKTLEPNVIPDVPAAAFNITILSQMLGTPLEPDLADHVLMLEEVSEQMYRIDRALFHITSNPAIRNVAGIRLGRCSEIVPNDPDFGQTEEQVVKYWCGKSGIAYLGRADIGHDIANKIVPFGRRNASSQWGEA
jgi:muramoyltetrapeptide carboxypeptidase